MSNSTQNDEIEVDGETYTKWDTQNDEIKQMERAINEGFAESEKFLKGMRSPFDKSSTQNDHETHNVCNERLEREGSKTTCCDCDPHEGCTLGERVPEASKTIKKDWAIEYIKMRTTNTSTISQEVDYIDTLLADARREVIEKVEKGFNRYRSDKYKTDSLALSYKRWVMLKNSIIKDDHI